MNGTLSNKSNAEVTDGRLRKKRTFIPIRIIVVLLGIYSCALLYTQRTSLSVGIVAMVRHNRPEESGRKHICGKISGNDSRTMTPNIYNSSGVEHGNNHYANHVHTHGPTFDWNESMEGIVLSAHLWLYTFAPAFSGRLCDRFGGKWVTFVGNCGGLLLTAITPIVIEQFGVTGLIIVRVLLGLFHGCIFAPLFTLFVRWFPVKERASANATITFGAAIGATVMSPLAGFLSSTRFGWPSIFYVNSIMFVPFLLLWLYFVTDTPAENKHISEEELYYIMAHMPPSSDDSKMRTPAPWGSILTSRPVICSAIVKLCAGYGFFLLLSKIPTYLSTIFGISLLSNGTIFAAMVLGQGLISLLSGPFSSWVIVKTGARSIVIRKIFQSLAMLCPAVCLALIPTAGCNSGLVITCLMLSLCTYGMVTGGEWTTVSEYAPRNSGVVFGITNAWAVIGGIIGSYFVGIIVGDDPTQHLARWSIVFYLTAVVFCIGALTFILFGTDQPQSWDSQNCLQDIQNASRNVEVHH